MEPCFRPVPAIQTFAYSSAFTQRSGRCLLQDRPHRRREYFHTPNTTFPITLLEGRYRIESELGEEMNPE